MHLIYITTKNKEEAISISNILVKEQLIACANIFENVTSIYQWEGKINSTPENVIICKVKSELVDDVISKVRQIHNYECPCITAIKIEKSNEDFNNWVDGI